MRTYNDIQIFYLTRLYRMTDLALKRTQEANTDWKKRLLRRAIYSTLCDCLELEVGAEALRILRRRASAIPR